VCHRERRCRARLSSSRGLIEKTPGVCGGDTTVVRTRVPIWVLETGSAQRHERRPICFAYAFLHGEALAKAWVYVRYHSDKIDRMIRDNETT
jgi:uncharacterized protein (DUF433 family)